MTHPELLTAVLNPDRVREMVEPVAGGDAAVRLERLLLQCAHRLREIGVGPTEPVHVVFVPGRIEVLGKHTDYAGGRSLLAALDRGICLVATPRQDEIVVVADALAGEQTRFPLSVGLQPQPGWPNYPMTVARRVARNFPTPLRGTNIAFASSLPIAAGMSSSSALIVAVFLALSAVNGLASTAAYEQNIRSPEDLADYLASIESGRDYRGLPGGRGVGTRGGSQDHTAILCARPREVVQYSFAPVRFERSARLPSGYIFCIGVSGVAAEKTGAAKAGYNRAAERMQHATACWRTRTGQKDATLGAALDADPLAAAQLRRILRDDSCSHSASAAVLARVDQFIEESCVLVPAAGDALARGDLETFAQVVERSQQLAEIALENQVPETVALARSARALGGVAASAFGAGFGGSVWALAEETRAHDFLEGWRSAYLAHFPQHAAAATFFMTSAGSPAVSLT